ncbi:MAG: hypothetical protein VX951_00500 [Planctomycetota bacterium]|nr:hypothetical protein [Planctomycetota bacterium]
MAHLPIQCQNCGAKYKIPETFPGDFAKCKACGNKMDVNAARGAKSTAPDSEASATASHTTGGTRKPRQGTEARTGTRRKRGEEEASPKKSRRAASGSSRRSRRGADDNAEEEEEETGRRGQRKKKDNTPLILGVSLGVLAVVVVIMFMMWGDDDKTTQTKNQKAAKNDKVATKPAEDATKKAAEEAAKAKAAEAAKAEAAEAAAKKKAAKKKLDIKKVADVMTAADIFKPATLDKLPPAKDTTEEELTAINEQLDLLKEGGGLGFIRAPGKLKVIGAKMIPLAVNRLMTLDYSKVEDNQYAFAISEAIKGLTEFELAFDPARIIDEFTIKQGHTNATKVKDLHFLTRKYWQTDKSIQAHIASRAKDK